MSDTPDNPLVLLLAALRQTGGLDGADIAAFAAVPETTLSRWSRGEALPHPRTQLILCDLRYVVMRLGAYYAAGEIRAWLYARHPQLGGARAIDLIREDTAEEVVAVLDRLEADVYL